jgi:hypothetical protein
MEQAKVSIYAAPNKSFQPTARRLLLINVVWLRFACVWLAGG